jgi:primary-amine oxidase
MLAKGSTVANLGGGHNHSEPDLQFGHLVAPHVLAPHHQHFFNVRLDMDVDGTSNSVSEIETKPVSDSSANPAGNAFVMTETPILSEQASVRDLDFFTQRKWKIYNPGSITPKLGYARGYILVPGDNSSPYLQSYSPLLRRGAFVSHHVWFTQQNDNEMYAAGPYPTQRETSDGLPEWIKQNRGLQNSDVVAWYSFALTHAPRPEEWPVMVVHKTGFKLIPAGFFDHNPALDVRR